MLKEEEGSFGCDAAVVACAPSVVLRDILGAEEEEEESNHFRRGLTNLRLFVSSSTIPPLQSLKSPKLSPSPVYEDGHNEV